MHNLQRHSRASDIGEQLGEQEFVKNILVAVYDARYHQTDKQKSDRDQFVKVRALNKVRHLAIQQ